MREWRFHKDSRTKKTCFPKMLATRFKVVHAYFGGLFFKCAMNADFDIGLPMSDEPLILKTTASAQGGCARMCVKQAGVAVPAPSVSVLNSTVIGPEKSVSPKKNAETGGRGQGCVCAQSQAWP